jgi:hypothetical protein
MLNNLEILDNPGTKIVSEHVYWNECTHIHCFKNRTASSRKDSASVSSLKSTDVKIETALS